MDWASISFTGESELATGPSMYETFSWILVEEQQQKASRLSLSSSESRLIPLLLLFSSSFHISHTLHDRRENAINNWYKEPCSVHGDKLGMTKYQLPAAQLKALSVQLVITFNLIRTPGIVSIS